METELFQKDNEEKTRSSRSASGTGRGEKAGSGVIRKQRPTNVSLGGLRTRGREGSDHERGWWASRKGQTNGSVGSSGLLQIGPRSPPLPGPTRHGAVTHSQIPTNLPRWGAQCGETHRNVQVS